MPPRIDRCRERFLAFRGGGAFLVFVTVTLAGWWAAHLLFGFDPDKSTANFWMSVEACMTTSMLLDLQVKTTARDRATFERILAIEERIDHAVEGDTAMAEKG